MKNGLPWPGLNPAKKTIGLDLGFHSIKLVELVPRAGGFEITGYGRKEIPSSVLAKKDRAGDLAALVKGLFAEAGVKGKKVYLSVSGHNVVIRRTTLPKMPPAELIEAIRWNSREEVLFNMDGASIDYHVMGEVEKDGGNFYELLCVIVRADVLPFMVSIVEQAGLQPLGVTVVPMTLWDYDQSLHPPQEGEISCYVDMGAERTRVYFVSGRELLFSREIPNGGKNITASLIGHYELDGDRSVYVDETRAEAIKKSFGLPSESDTGQTPEGIPLPNIRERVLPVLERQGEELERSIEYFKNQYKKDLVHRMVLSGGGVGLKGLDRFLNRHFDIALEHCNVLLKSQGGPANRNRDATDPIGPALTVAAGLALGRCGKINVLPEEWRASFKKKLLKNVPVMVLALLLAVFGGMSVHLRQTRDAVRDQVSFQKAELAREKLKMEFLKKPVHLLASLKKENRQLQEEMESLQPGGPRMLAFFPPMLDELSHIVPSNVSLSEITFSVSQKGKRDPEDAEEGNRRENRILIRGNIFGNEGEIQSTLNDFLQALKMSPAFREVRWVRSTAADTPRFSQPAVDFELYVYPRFSDEVLADSL